MIVVMAKDSTPEQLEEVKSRIARRPGLEPQVSEGAERTVVGVKGSVTPDMRDEMSLVPGVSEVIPITKPYKLACREFHPENSVIMVDDVAVGGPEPVVMAGPCVVENEEQLVSTAMSVKASGARILRGGAYKPRSSPYSFRGMGVEGLKLLQIAKQETGLPIITEVMTPGDVDTVAQYSDVLQIGARNMQNYNLLDAAGETRMPVMVKRGLSATYEEWLLAAEYVLAGGNEKVMLCERGIRSFESTTRFTMDVAAIPVMQRLSHLPIIGDPSHSTGQWYLVSPVALSAIAAGANGLLVEVCPNPDSALCDGPQALTFANFANMMEQVRAVDGALRKEPVLA